MSDLIIMRGGDGLPKTSKLVAKRRALVTGWLEHAAEPFQVAKDCDKQMCDLKIHSSPQRIEERFLDSSKNLINRMLRDIVKVTKADNTLDEIISPYYFDRMTRAMAGDMLSVLFSALSKRRSDESDENATILLMECADMFSPTADIVGDATGLWKALPKHPVILAIAIKRLIAVQKFSPEPRELREAIKLAYDRVRSLANLTTRWLEIVGHADAVVFEFERENWRSIYESKVPLEIVLAMTGLADDNTPRGEALSAIFNARDEAETAAKLAAETAPTLKIAAARKLSERKRSKPEPGR